MATRSQSVIRRGIVHERHREVAVKALATGRSEPSRDMGQPCRFAAPVAARRWPVWPHDGVEQTGRLGSDDARSLNLSGRRHQQFDRGQTTDVTAKEILRVIVRGERDRRRRDGRRLLCHVAISAAKPCAAKRSVRPTTVPTSRWLIVCARSQLRPHERRIRNEFKFRQAVTSRAAGACDQDSGTLASVHNSSCAAARLGQRVSWILRKTVESEEGPCA